MQGFLGFDNIERIHFMIKKFNEYMCVKEAANFLGVTSNTLRNWEKEHKIKVFRNPQNKYRLYDKDDLEQLLQNIHQVQ